MRAGIFGAGQAGMMARDWLPADVRLECLIDNRVERAEGGVLSLRAALERNLDLILIAVLNREAVRAIRVQLQEEGFAGKVLDLEDIRQIQDIRLAALRLAARQIRDREVPGAAAELGVYRGDFAGEINRLLPDRPLYLFDTFSGFAQEDLKAESCFQDFSDTSVERVMARLPHPSRAVFVEGRFPGSLGRLRDEPASYALVSLDADLYEPTRTGLEYFWPRMACGGIILVHDYTSSQFPGVRRAVDEYCGKNGLFLVPLMDLHGTAVLLKQGS